MAGVSGTPWTKTAVMAPILPPRSSGLMSQVNLSQAAFRRRRPHREQTAGHAPNARIPCERPARAANGGHPPRRTTRAAPRPDPCAKDRSRASTSVLACSRMRAVRTRRPGGYGPSSGPCPRLAGSSPSRSVRRNLSPQAGTGHCSGSTWRCGSAMPCGAPVRHVLPHLPAARGPRRPDRIRIHRDDSSVDGSGPRRGRQPAVPACPRAHSRHALTAAYASSRLSRAVP